MCRNSDNHTCCRIFLLMVTVYMLARWQDVQMRMSLHRGLVGTYLVAGRQAVCVKEEHFITKEKSCVVIILDTIVYSQSLICPI